VEAKNWREDVIERKFRAVESIRVMKNVVRNTVKKNC
jgi:hypothetical protein